MISAKIIADSIAPSNVRLTTFVLTYPRFIHSEFMTHRVFSRNASSSRAIPTNKFIDDIKNDTAMPTSFSKNCKGMQAKEEINNQDEAKQVWLEARDSMLKFAEKLSSIGVHKQHANRLLEPFQHMSVICTSTFYSNFFALRTHKDAQPEFQELANKMLEIYHVSEPDELLENEWHLPFVTPKEKNNVMYGLITHDDLIKISVARCARVSYKNHDGTINSLEKDIELYSRLILNSPMHASPAEHQAMAISDPNVISGNFKGWLQFRKSLANENIL